MSEMGETPVTSHLEDSDFMTLAYDEMIAAIRPQGAAVSL